VQKASTKYGLSSIVVIKKTILFVNSSDCYFLPFRNLKSSANLHNTMKKQAKKLKEKVRGKKQEKDEKEDNEQTENQEDTKVFGVPLEEAAQKTDPEGLIPSPLRNAINWLNQRGLHCEGLYRVPGLLHLVLLVF